MKLILKRNLLKPGFMQSGKFKLEFKIELNDEEMNYITKTRSEKEYVIFSKEIVNPINNKTFHESFQINELLTWRTYYVNSIFEVTQYENLLDEVCERTKTILEELKKFDREEEIIEF